MPSRFERAAEPSLAFKEHFQRRDAKFERVDLVDQLRLHLTKALLPDCGWIGHVPFVANRLYLVDVFLKKRTLSHSGETSQFVPGRRAAIYAAKSTLAVAPRCRLRSGS